MNIIGTANSSVEFLTAVITSKDNWDLTVLHDLKNHTPTHNPEI